MGWSTRPSVRKGDRGLEGTLSLKGFLTSLVAAAIALAVLASYTLPARSQQASGQARRAISPGRLFSAAIEAGDYVFLSGALGRGPDGKLVPGGIVPETRQAMENLKATLAKAGLEMKGVVKVTVFLKNPDDFRAMNEVYQTYFPADPPARTTVVAGFPLKEANVEIDMIAYRGR